MTREMSCRRWIPTFTLTILLVLPAAGVAGAPAREPADRGRVSMVLESLWQWLGLVAARSTEEEQPSNAVPTTGGGTPTGTGGGSEGTGTYDPNGTGSPPPEYDPDLNPGGG